MQEINNDDSCEQQNNQEQQNEDIKKDENILNGNKNFCGESFYDNNPLPKVPSENQSEVVSDKPQEHQSYTSPEKAMPPKRKDKGIIVVIVIICILVISALGIIAAICVNTTTTTQHTPPKDITNPNVNIETNNKPDNIVVAPKPDGTYTPQEIYKLLSPSVVGVTIYGDGGMLTEMGNATGIIISKDGYIVTNAHVIEGASSQRVTLFDGKKFIADVVGSDTKTDMAVLKIDPKDYVLTTANLGNSNELETGEKVIAIGNPAGFTNSLTGGYVSYVNRELTVTDGHKINCIQTDAALNPGNSGGPLINEYGQVIGINAFGYIGDTGQYQGMNFAIAINDALPVIKSLITDGYVKGRIRVGIVFKELPPAFADQYEIPAGLYILEIDPTTDIAKTDLQLYDIITKVNGQSVHTKNDMIQVLNDKKPGDTVSAHVFRKTITDEIKEFDISFNLMEQSK